MNFDFISDMTDYFWSKSENGTILIGGIDKGRNYGKIEFTLNEDHAIIKIVVSNGVSSVQNLNDEYYYSNSKEYLYVKNLYQKIDLYLSNPTTISNQENNREELMINTMKLLPKYNETN